MIKEGNQTQTAQSVENVLARIVYKKVIETRIQVFFFCFLLHLKVWLLRRCVSFLLQVTMRSKMFLKNSVRKGREKNVEAWSKAQGQESSSNRPGLGRRNRIRCRRRGGRRRRGRRRGRSKKWVLSSVPWITSLKTRQHEGYRHSFILEQSFLFLPKYFPLSFCISLLSVSLSLTLHLLLFSSEKQANYNSPCSVFLPSPSSRSLVIIG